MNYDNTYFRVNTNAYYTGSANSLMDSQNSLR